MKFFIKKIYKIFFNFFEKYLGIHITARSYYSPIPTLFEISDDQYNKDLGIEGINYDHQKSKEIILSFLKYQNEYLPNKNPGLSKVDAYMLYSFVRYKDPKKIIEVGSGESTKIIFNALKIKNNYEKFCTVDPYPERIKNILDGIVDSKFVQIKQKVQYLDNAFFSDTDILFIDSSHIVKIGSDVVFEIFEILPQLKSGTLIHFHDIWLPGNYPKDITQSGYQFWNESYFLHAFLLNNYHYEVLYLGNFLKKHDLNFLKKNFPFFDQNHRLTSLWMVKK